MQNVFAGAFSTALEMQRARAEVKNLKEQNLNLKAQNRQIDSQTDLNRKLAEVAGVDKELKETKVPESRATSEIYEGKKGFWLKLLEKAVQAGTSVMRRF